MAGSDNEMVVNWPLENGEPGREVWYGFVTVPARPLALWYRYTLVSTTSGHQEARCWAGVTDGNDDRSTFQTRAVPPSEVKSGQSPFKISFEGLGGLRDDRVQGRIDGDISIEWDLRHDPDSFSFRPLRSRTVTNLASVVLGTGRHWSRNESIRSSGRITVGEAELEVSNAPGHQGHTVGASTPERWRWLQCNSFGVDGLAVEALDLNGRVSICLRTARGDHQLNRLVHVIGPWANRTVEGAPGIWEFTGRGDSAEVRCRVEADRDHWQHVAYRCPDDSRRYNAHCSLSSVKLKIRRKTERGWSDWRAATSESGRAEWVDTEPPVDGTYEPSEWAVESRG